MDFGGLCFIELGYVLAWWLPLEHFQFSSVLENPENFTISTFESTDLEFFSKML